MVNEVLLPARLQGLAFMVMVHGSSSAVSSV
jgi:hypothetical protein